MAVVRIESALEQRGQTCGDTEAGLRARLGANFRIASIGPAGENLVRYATVSHDGRHAGRAAAGRFSARRTSRRLPCGGTQRVEWAHPRE